METMYNSVDATPFQLLQLEEMQSKEVATTDVTSSSESELIVTNIEPSSEEALSPSEQVITLPTLLPDSAEGSNNCIAP